MRNRKFKEYSPLRCVKINLFTSFILFILFICSKVFMEDFQTDVLDSVKDLDNAAGGMVAIVFFGGLVGILLISYSMLVPLIIPLFNNFNDNLKSLIGLVIVNFGIGYFLFSNFTLQLGLLYFLTVSVGMYFFVCLRYWKKKDTEMNV